MSALLCPTPQIYRTGGQSFLPPQRLRLVQEARPLLDDTVLRIVGEMLERLLPKPGDRATTGEDAYTVRLVRAPGELPNAYRLIAGADGATITAEASQGALHGLATLCQLCLNPELPACHIEDAPVLPVRGYMLDISRDRVPTAHTLRQLLDRLWLLKYNQLQLYMEHTFAFSGHERVWGLAAPLDKDFVLWLQGECRARGIELVPNFNSLGHFERWLRHPEYRHLAETQGNTRMPSGRGLPHCTTLAPGPEAVDFLRGLYEEFLPLFESPQFNAGLDEPWELGMGRSRERCEREGKHRVYLDHLRQVNELTRAHGKKLQFWADIVLERPELVPELPEGVTGLVWGYEGDHPFEEQAAHFAQAGVPFILCPGTGAWSSFGGRWPTAAENIRECVAAAIRHDSLGVLLTDWGDDGHHQPPSVSLPSLALCAQLSWSAREGAEVADVIDRLILRDSQRRIGGAILELGSVWTSIHHRVLNAGWLFQYLMGDAMRRVELRESVTPDNLREVRKRLDCVVETIAAAGIGDPGSLAALELKNAAAFLDVAAMQALHDLGEPVEDQEGILARLTLVLGEFESIWCFRNWPGGLHESSARIRKLLE